MIRLAALLSVCASTLLAQPSEPDGYRMDHYRAPVPAALEGAVTIDVAQAYLLWSSGAAAFVDVWPRAPKPDRLPEGTIWREPQRHSIPGSIWLPNVGYGALADVTDAYFRRGMKKATGDDLTHPVVLFCLEDCWMSWNAAKRALNYGYETVYWMPDGTDGWAFYDYPLEQVEAEPEP